MNVTLDLFEGPLDLLLYLVKKDHINICDLSVTEITEQYLSYLEWMKSLDINIASEYMVLAATLIFIKSKMLLPQPEKEEQEEDPREMLINRLLEYQRYKEVVKELRQREEEQHKVFMRAPKKIETQDTLFEASIFDLITALRRVLQNVPREIFLEVIKDEYTIEDKINQIVGFLEESPMLKFSEIFSQARDKVEIVAFFLAILEMVRLKEIVAAQTQLFGEIILMKRQNA